MLGAFAFAIWDKREQHLFCARDHLGIKPLFYRETDSAFAIATELPVLKNLANKKLTLNINKVADHLLAVQNTDDTVTYFNEIKSISTGSYLIQCRNHRVREHKYWSLTEAGKVELHTPSRWYEELRHRLETAVHDRLRSNKKIGSLLSGGLDSSYTTAIALQKKPEDVIPITYVFNDTHQSDERNYALSVLNMYDKKGVLINMDSHSPLYKWYKIQRSLGHPVHNSTARATLRCVEEMSESNLRVLITGYDGDTTISHGKGHLYDLISKRKYIRLMYEVSLKAYRLNESIPSVLKAWVTGPIYTDLLKKPIDNIGSSVGRITKDSKWFTKYFISQCTKVDEERSEIRNRGTLEYRSHVSLLKRPLLDETTTFIDNIGSRRRIEFRHPFFDKRLIELCISVPGDLKLKHGWSRYIVRKSLGNALPSEVKWRRDKNNFEPALINGLLKYERGTLKDFRDHVSDTALSEWVRVSEVTEAADRFLEDPYQLSQWRRTQLWRALAMFLWLKSVG